MIDRTNPYDWETEAPPEGVFIGAEPSLSLLGMPEGGSKPTRINPYQQRETAARSAKVRVVLEDICRALDASARDGCCTRLALDALNAEDIALLSDILGQGEASALIATPDGLLQAGETVFPGVWMVQPESPLHSNWIEICDVPSSVRETLAAMAARRLPLEHIVPPDGTMNVMGVLAEIRHVSGAWRQGTPNHVLNFTLLPMTEPDTAFLTQMLGHGPVQISSGGYGAARIIATAFAHVWAVQYLNSMGAVILDTLEIGDVPTAARAAREDFEDSAVRLRHILSGDLQ